MEQNKTAVEWLFHQLWEEPKDKFTWYAILKEAKEMEKKQIMLGITKHLPIEDGVITAVQKAEQYYNEEYGTRVD